MKKYGVISFSFIFVLFGIIFISNGCQHYKFEDRTNFKTLSESEVSIFPLAGELAEKRAELSGLAWYKNNLILLPQYPQLYKENYDGALFSVTKEELQSCKDGNYKKHLSYKKIEMDFNGLDKSLIREGSGFESVAFYGKDVFFTIESGGHFNTYGNVIKGVIDEEKNIIKLFPESIKKIEPQAHISNLSEEAITLYQKKIYTFYEANGHNVAANPVVHTFDYSLNPIGTIPIENIEYRITDATYPDSSGNFWAINYLWPDDASDLLPAGDKEFRKFGVGESQQKNEIVERLIELKIDADKISRTNEAPIYLKLDTENGSRNWEGIVRFGQGFILVTDKYPETILGYVPK